MAVLVTDPPPTPRRRLSWDRVLSVFALVTSVVAAAGTIWQAIEAKKTREDALRLGQERPPLHITGAHVQASRPFFNTLILDFRNDGLAPAIKISVEMKSGILGRKVPKSSPDNDTPDLVDRPFGADPGGYFFVESIQWCDQSSEATDLPVGKETRFSLAERQYHSGDMITISGKLTYYSEDGRAYGQYLCYDFEAAKSGIANPRACLKSGDTWGPKISLEGLKP